MDDETIRSSPIHSAPYFLRLSSTQRPTTRCRIHQLLEAPAPIPAEPAQSRTGFAPTRRASTYYFLSYRQVLKCALYCTFFARFLCMVCTFSALFQKMCISYNCDLFFQREPSSDTAPFQQISGFIEFRVEVMHMAMDHEVFDQAEFWKAFLKDLDAARFPSP